MRALLTGGTGTVGLGITEVLLKNGIDTVVYAVSAPPNSAAAAFAGFPGSLTYVEGDVLDREQIADTMATYGIDAVVHGAAITPNESRERRDPASIFQINCVGALETLTAAADSGIDKFLFLGSVAAYGAASRAAEILDEEASREQPENLYEISKLAGEKAVIRAGRLRGLKVASARIGDVFGRWERPTQMRDTMSGPFQAVRLALSGTEARLPRPGRKAWVYNADVGRAIYALLIAQELRHTVYNVSSPFVWSMEDWCRLLAQRYPKFGYRTSGERDANVTLFADNPPMALSRISKDAGFSARFDLQASFDDYMTWLEEQMIDGEL